MNLYSRPFSFLSNMYTRKAKRRTHALVHSNPYTPRILSMPVSRHNSV